MVDPGTALSLLQARMKADSAQLLLSFSNTRYHAA